MTNPTRDQIMQAYTALTGMCEIVERHAGYRPTEFKRAILAALPQQPLPTMAEVEWDDDDHYLAEAEHKSCGKVIMLGLDEDGLVEFFIPKARASRYDAAYRGSLTLTGRRYELTEAQDD